MHEAMYLTLGVQQPTSSAHDELEHFHLLREMRNAQIHAGGAVSTRLRDAATQLSTSAA
jgi:hypothetical protein